MPTEKTIVKWMRKARLDACRKAMLEVDDNLAVFRTDELEYLMQRIASILDERKRR